MVSHLDVESIASSTSSRVAEHVICVKRSLQRPRKREYHVIESTTTTHSPSSFVVVADYRKNSEFLGTNVRMPPHGSEPPAHDLRSMPRESQ